MVINSETLGYSFWKDQNGTLMSSPLFLDGTSDDENSLAVEDWQCLGELSIEQSNCLDDIIKIFYQFG
tara:strand:+ start:2047 stop:2250 length:204 start_codon:yes stop_codon:yes gene_type:complete